LRDDLFDLFQRLIILYKNKLTCLEKIASNEIQLLYLLRSDNVAGIKDLLQEDKEVFSKLGSIEFDISLLISKICRTAGIEENNFIRFFLSRDEAPIPDLKKLKEDIDKKASDLIKERDSLIKDMGDHLTDIKADIDSLQKVRGMDFKKM
jgi:hypothetical protein